MLKYSNIEHSHLKKLKVRKDFLLNTRKFVLRYKILNVGVHKRRNNIIRAKSRLINRKKEYRPGQIMKPFDLSLCCFWENLEEKISEPFSVKCRLDG